MALGAQRRDILFLAMSQMVPAVGLGLVVGLAAAYALNHLLGSMLYDVGSTDLATFAAAGILLATVAALAAYLPARRAAQVDPLMALRYE
jgi:ABC-type antimicrobial peptide transport system permease subunit